MTRDQIRSLQRYLNSQLPYMPSLEIDGYWGARTQAAAMGLQASRGLEPTGTKQDILKLMQGKTPEPKKGADIALLVPKILKWEGGYVNDPLDKGGCTNKGVTIAAYRQYVNPRGTCNDLKLLTDAEFTKVLRAYWDRWRADEIKDQQIAEILVDWVWGSGAWGIKIPQRLLGVAQDGVVGPATIAALNAKDPVSFHNAIYTEREKFLNGIVQGNPSQKRFINGWLNRLRDFKRN